MSLSISSLAPQRNTQLISSCQSPPSHVTSDSMITIGENGGGCGAGGGDGGGRGVGGGDGEGGEPSIIKVCVPEIPLSSVMSCCMNPFHTFPFHPSPYESVISRTQLYPDSTVTS